MAALVVGVASGLAATRAGKAPKEQYKVSVALKGARGISGVVSGELATQGAVGSLVWKLTLKPKKVAKEAGPAELRAGTTGRGKLLVTLCKKCAVGAHGKARVKGAVLKTLVSGKAGVVVHVKKAVLHGVFKATSSSTTGSSSGQGTMTIKPTRALVAKGKAAVATFSCAGCHTITGGKSVGPTWKGLFGSKVRETGGKVVVADAAYLYGIITDPSSADVAGYSPSIMSEVIPPGAVSDTQAKAIVAYIETLK